MDARRLQGRPAHGDRAIAAAREMKHGTSEEFAIGYQTLLFHLHRDPERIISAAEETLRLGAERGSAFWSRSP
jgi:hypothetical protein